MGTGPGLKGVVRPKGEGGGGARPAWVGLSWVCVWGGSCPESVLAATSLGEQGCGGGGRQGVGAPPIGGGRGLVVQTRRPHVSALLGLFWNHRFCGSNPIETVVCSVVRAAGGVCMGGKALVWLYSHVLFCSGVCAGLLDTFLWS